MAKPMTTKDKIREWISDNLRYMLLIGAILLIVAAVLLIVHLVSPKNDGKSSGGTVTSSSTGNNVPDKKTQVKADSKADSEDSTGISSDVSDSANDSSADASSTDTASAPDAEAEPTSEPEAADDTSNTENTDNTAVSFAADNVPEVSTVLEQYYTDGMGYWQALTEEGIDFKGMKMVLIGTGGAATAIAVRGALDGVAEIEIFNIKDKFYSRGEEIVNLINKNTNCKATMNDLADKDLLKEKMHAADLFCDATGVGMHPLEDLSNIPDPSFFKKDLIVTDTVYAPRETVMMKQAKEAGCEKVFNGMGMMLFQALIAIKLYTGKDTPVDYMKEKLGI